jgi:hypothetical protein
MTNTNNNNKNTQNNNNQKVIVNINSSTLHEHHKRKKRPSKPRKEPEETSPVNQQVSSNIYYPQTSMITNSPHAPIPDYFQTALTNRDLAVSSLQSSAMAHDHHHAMRQAYAVGAVPGGVGVREATPPAQADEPIAPEIQPEEQAVPQPHEDELNSTSASSASSASHSSFHNPLYEVGNSPADVPLPDNMSLESGGSPRSNDTVRSNDIESPHHSDTQHSPARTLEDLYLQYREATNPRAKQRYALDISNHVGNHDINIYHPTINSSGAQRRRGVPSLVEEFRNRHRDMYASNQIVPYRN